MMSELVTLKVILKVTRLEETPIYQEFPSFAPKQTSLQPGFDVHENLRRRTPNRFAYLHCSNTPTNLGFLFHTQFVGVGVVQTYDEIVGKAGHARSQTATSLPFEFALSFSRFHSTAPIHLSQFPPWQSYKPCESRPATNVDPFPFGDSSVISKPIRLIIPSQSLPSIWSKAEVHSHLVGLWIPALAGMTGQKDSPESDGCVDGRIHLALASWSLSVRATMRPRVIR